MNYLQSRALPLHCLGQAWLAVLRDKDIACEIQTRMIEKFKKGFVKAEDVVDLVASPEIQKVFSEKGICKPLISKKTATRWLQKLNWRYQGTRNGMYIDGYEREDVVAYRCEFVERWGTYKKCFHQWDDDGHELPHPNGFPVPDGLPFQLVLITHDESTFYQNDRRKTAWAQKNTRPVPQPKGDGQTIMVLDFLTSKWGPLRDGHEFVHHHFSSLPSINLPLGKLVLSSKLARIVMDILAQTISLHKLICLSTSLKAFPKGMLRCFSFSITHQAIKNKLRMRYQHKKCQKVHPFHLSFYLISLPAI